MCLSHPHPPPPFCTELRRYNAAEVLLRLHRAATDTGSCGYAEARNRDAGTRNTDLGGEKMDAFKRKSFFWKRRKTAEEGGGRFPPTPPGKGGWGG